MEKLDQWTDEELREGLIQVDKGREEVSDWEADFIESVVYKHKGTLSKKQREAAYKIIVKYIYVGKTTFPDDKIDWFRADQE